MPRGVAVVAEDRSAIGRVFGAIVPRAVDSIDPDQLIDRIDVDALMARVDVDALIGRVDIDGLISRVDVDSLLRRIDVDALLQRIDVDGLVQRVDVDALIARLDVDAMLTKVDVKAMVDRAGIDAIVAEATTGVAARTLDLARRQIVGLDLIVLGFVDRLLRRGRPSFAPDHSATGRPAGPVARLLGFLVDSALVSVLFSLMVTLARSAVELFSSRTLSTNGHELLWSGVFLSWWFVYLWVCLVIAGRTPGKALVGTRVVAVDGRPLSAGRAAVRVVVFPLSFVLGLGFLLGVVRRDRRALHDLVAGSAEITDWGDRVAELPSALSRWVDQHRPEAPAAIEVTTPEALGGEALGGEALGVR